ncbi:hypothetical protein B0H13DRAFT_1894751 [Mycena leptocephala]|nr:hypothetical protein B0H13DRAFT_1894751 [Mycena leptocephala]
MSKVHHLPDGGEVTVEELVATANIGFGSNGRHRIRRAKLQGLPLDGRYECTKEKNNGTLFRDEINLVEQLPQQAIPMELRIFCVRMIETSGSHGRSVEFLENRRTNGKGLTVAVLHVTHTARNVVIFEADARGILKQEGQHWRGLNEPTIHVHAGQETLPRKYQSEILNEEAMHKLCQNIDRPEPGERRRWYQVPSVDQIIPPRRGAFQDNGSNLRATPAGA